MTTEKIINIVNFIRGEDWRENSEELHQTFINELELCWKYPMPHTFLMLYRFNNEHGTDVFYIDSSDWIPFEPLHPLRDGHKIIARHLTEILKEKYSL